MTGSVKPRWGKVRWHRCPEKADLGRFCEA